jgi:hypothetical protein
MEMRIEERHYGPISLKKQLVGADLQPCDGLRILFTKMVRLPQPGRTWQ